MPAEIIGKQSAIRYSNTPSYGLAAMRFPLDCSPRKGFEGTGRAFGAVRNGRKHAGVDLLVPIGTKVLAMSDGITSEFVAKFYTKSDMAIAIVHGDLTVRYCEIKVLDKFRKPGVKVTQGEVIGAVSVLTEHNASMLHVEMYNSKTGVGLTVRGQGEYSRSKDLIDPTDIIIKAAIESGISIPASIAGNDATGKNASCGC